ncbi:MAG: hypothetical protein PHG85_00190 [Candidatus Altiarchaeota archaeon]|nr:hypothetical protein [Candidatus Altiarchaeota archaeon]
MASVRRVEPRGEFVSRLDGRVDEVLKSNFPDGIGFSSVADSERKRSGLSVGVLRFVRESLGLSADTVGPKGLAILREVESQDNRLGWMGGAFGMILHAGLIMNDPKPDVARRFFETIRDDLAKYGDIYPDPTKRRLAAAVNGKLGELGSMQLDDVMADPVVGELLNASKALSERKVESVIGGDSKEYYERFKLGMRAAGGKVRAHAPPFERQTGDKDQLISVIERRPDAEVGAVADFEKLKGEHPPDSSIKFRDYSREFIYLEQWEGAVASRRMNQARRIIPKADAAEVERNLLA